MRSVPPERSGRQLLTKGESMTKEEVIEALEKSGVDYEFIAEHFDCMRIKVNFEPEEEEAV